MTVTLAPQTQTPAAEGSLIVTTGTSVDLAWWRDREYPEGLHGIVQSYVPAEESQDGHAYYWVSLAGRFHSATVAAEHVRVAKTPSQVARAQLPRLGSITEHVQRSLTRAGDGFTVTRADLDDDGSTITLHARTEDGLTFGVQMSVGEPFEVN